MRFALFYHSVRSDWNHGNAPFLRGVVRALVTLGHDAVCYEEEGNWSVANLVAQHGLRPLVQFHRRFPFIRVRLYRPEPLGELERCLRRELSGVDVVILHEWTAVENPLLVDLLVRCRAACGYILLFHDTHHRIISQPVRMARLGFERFDAILAFGPSMAEEYRRRFGLTEVHVLHEAADVSVFHPLPPDSHRPMDDAVFIGNWGGQDRAREMREFLLRPARRFRNERRFALYGARYPERVLTSIQRYYGVEYRGWLPNVAVPHAFAQARLVPHIIRRQYREQLSGIPTIRPFEVLACGKALVSTRWQDTDRLFREGIDYLMVDTRAQMEAALDWLWRDDAARERLAGNGLQRVLEQHTCMHRAEELLAIVARLRGGRLAGLADARRATRNGHAAVHPSEPLPVLIAANGAARTIGADDAHYVKAPAG